MIISRSQATQINRTIAQADSLKQRVDGLAAKIAKLDGVCGVDIDGAADSVRIKDTIPVASGFRRFFSLQSPLTAEVKSNPETQQPESAKIESGYGLLSRARYEMSTSEGGEKTYSLTQLHPIGEEILESYTFGANGTITVNT